ncbi:hypothetical protein ANN_05255 [Periplaneta americana]|uniref:Uncharacterized protein n=1 Tax=Periplaneta americana TaxID=6978 RepID=A0ABQ8TC99_PERAM|nr:hypothetical protein ANN_05255 [Periplaneta americana]
MAGLCKGGNEPSGSLKAILNYDYNPTDRDQLTFTDPQERDRPGSSLLFNPVLTRKEKKTEDDKEKKTDDEKEKKTEDDKEKKTKDGRGKKTED